MISLLVTTVLGEIAMFLTLAFTNPLQNISVMTLDCLNQGKGPSISRTIAGILFAVLLYCFISIVKIQYLSTSESSVNLMDDLLVVNKMLAASLTGFLLVLSMVIGRLYQVIKESNSLGESIKEEKQQLSEKNHHYLQHCRVLEEKIAKLQAMIKILELECERKLSQYKAAETSKIDLRKQYDKFKLEYDQLLEYNETLICQLQSIDQSVLNDNQGKEWTDMKSSTMLDGLIHFPCSLQTWNKNREAPASEVEFQENESTKEGDKFEHCWGKEMCLPRHRRPIYQH
ncbi:hypothetical protein NMG60_11003121 [Bertholletia excelsa]